MTSRNGQALHSLWIPLLTMKQDKKKGAKLCSQTPLSLGSYNAIKGWWQHIKEKKTFFFATCGMATNLKF